MWRNVPMVLLVVLAVLAVAAMARAAERKAQGVSDDEVKKIAEAIPKTAPAKPAQPRKILIYSHCNGFVHGGAIERALVALPMMGEKTGAYTAVASDDLSNFEPDKLAQFDLVVFNNTTGEIFAPSAPRKPRKPDAKKVKDAARLQQAEEQYQKDLARYEEEMKKSAGQPNRAKELRANLLAWLKGGKGVMGNHSATDTRNCDEYNEMIGGGFSGHPWHENVVLKNDDPANPINAIFEGKSFEVVDEIYQFNRGIYSRDKQRVLLSIDMTKTKKKGGRKDDDYAISWIKKYGEGRVFYCSLGHRNEIFWNPKVLAHYLAGIQWALGDLQADCTPVPLK